jgi:VWFA-related protein
VKSLNLRFCLLLLLLGSTTHAQDTRTRHAEQKEPDTLDVIKVDSNLVSVPVIVSDREGRYVPNLTVEHFKLFDNTSEQKITYFDAAEQPLSIAVLLDTSRSTEGALDDIRKAAKNFLKELRPQDRAMIVSFDYAVHRLSDLTSDRKVLEEAIKQAKVGADFGTTLNDAVVEVARKEFRTITGRKAIILLSDGEDFGSVVETDALLNEESESDTMVYSIYYAPEFQRFRNRRPFPGGRDRRRGGGIFGRRRGGIFDHAVAQGPGQGRRRSNRVNGAEFLRELSELTSGRFYQSERTDLKKTFSLIAEELRHQYRLGFYPGELQRDGSLHQLRVKVDASDVAVRARQQYRAQ